MNSVDSPGGEVPVDKVDGLQVLHPRRDLRRHVDQRSKPEIYPKW